MSRPAWVTSYDIASLDALSSSQWAWDSGEDVANGTNYRQRSSLDSLRFVTDATSLSIEYYCSGTTFATQESISVFSNGVRQSDVTPGGVGKATATVTLPAGAGKLVEVYEGSQYAGPNGVWIRRIVANAPVAKLAPVAPTRRVVSYGDSKSDGLLVSPVSTAAWPFIVRGNYPGRLTSAARGSRSLKDDSAAAIAALILGECDGTVHNDVWLDMMFNDYYGPSGTGWGGWTAAGGYQTELSALLALLKASPKVQGLYVVGTILWANEGTANANGDTLAAFRSAASAAATANSCTYVDATNTAAGWPDPSTDLSGDGIHPNTSGNSKYATRFRATLGY